MATTAKIIAERLYEAGCRHAFGIPGGEILTLMDALAGVGIDFVLVKHENNGGFMAEGTHHFTRSPCILIATVGPGVANAINVVTNCFQDQVPLIFLTGCIDPIVTETFTHQVFDHGELLKSITKASFTMIDGASDVIIDKAVSIAMDEKPGPVHIDIPISIAEKNQSFSSKTRRNTPAPMRPAMSKDFNTARAWFKESRFPLIIAGIDVLHHDAAPIITEVIEKFKIPLITTYKAKGVLPEDHPCALGAAGLSPKADKILQPLIESSDLIILVGYDPIEMRASWVSPWTQSKMVIEFSATLNTHYMHQARFSFIGHVGAGLLSLTENIEAQEIWSDNKPSKIRKAHKEAFLSEESWGPSQIVKGARRALPRKGIATVDTGAHRIFVSQAWECFEPRSLLQSTGLCTMGVAIPLAIGRKLSEPNRHIIAFTGDAGLEMVLGEIATLRDLRLAIPIIIFVDEQLALIEMKQRQSQLTNLGVNFGGTDFVAVANGMGGVGVVATSITEVEKEIKAAFLRQTYTLIACPIGKNAYDGKI